MGSPIRLLSIDFDGTLVSRVTEPVFDSQCMELIGELQDAGAIWAINTGRSVDLLEKGASVKEACFAVGFDSVTSFTGLFKRRICLSPAAFQRQRELRKKEIAAVPLKHIPNCFAEKKGWTKKSNFREIETIDRDADAAR